MILKFLATLATLCAVSCTTQPSEPNPSSSISSADSSTSSSQATTVSLYFGDRAVIEVSDCSAFAGTERTIDVPFAQLPDATLRELFAGVTAEEEVEGLTDAFTGKSAPLIDSYQGVTIADGVATVDFTEGGMEYLNAEACWQGQVKTSIEETLFQFLAISYVQYSINGQVVTEWDA